MLGFGAISEFAISEIPGIGGVVSATLAAAGAGAFSATGRAMTMSVLASGGAGQFSAFATGTQSAVLNAHGAGAFNPRPQATITSIFRAAGVGAFTGLSPVFVPPVRRTGNLFLTTSYIVDMDMPRTPADAKPSKSGGKMRDAKGRKIYWD